MRYENRQPYKVTTLMRKQMEEMRAAGKTYSVIGGLLGLSTECVRKHLTGQRGAPLDGESHSAVKHN